ncbi:Pentatricopeptide repeat-containing protein [Acorus gramineus]|uniref:Pentatricopeptide repeat-containing protein n=1 Tax=Acorus gramineus TaxID=55184 RepID=A0AAV9B2X3_ACOGR|nr:Pentatricopeptide repeat-containing protein [Acorus gramineus]
MATITMTPSAKPPSFPIPTTSSPTQRHLLVLLRDSCLSISHLKQIHAQTLKTTTTSNNTNTIFLYSRIIHFAATHDYLSYASRILFHIDSPNSFTYNTLIRAYARSSLSHNKHLALSLYHRMLIHGVSPDNYTFPFVLISCAFLFAASATSQVHSQAIKMGFLRDNVHLNNSFVHAYASLDRLDLARRVFDGMTTHKNVVSWNVIIDGYARSGDYATALEIFREMQQEVLLFRPDRFTLQSVVLACGGLGALSLGMWAHAYMLLRGRENHHLLDLDLCVNNSLVDMYCKCGSIALACQVFRDMPSRDVATWNAMIMGFAMHGLIKEAFDAFSRMGTMDGLLPNSITFVGILSACNHGGLVKEGRTYFDQMVHEYEIEPRIEHYGCMVDLLARAGFIEEALTMVSNIPFKPDAVIWRSLLDACCRKNADVGVSESLARQVFELEERELSTNSGGYILLSKIYASASRWDDVGLIRRLMAREGIKKEPGCSSIEVDGAVHEFVAGDTSHPESQKIYGTLDMIELRLRAIGYVPDSSQAPMVAEVDDMKRRSLCLHSERLAIAYGLINLRGVRTIRVLKNLRVCDDCHTVCKLISRVFDVEIVLRDRVRFHYFKSGTCSCMDYW